MFQATFQSVTSLTALLVGNVVSSVQSVVTIVLELVFIHFTPQSHNIIVLSVRFAEAVTSPHQDGVANVQSHLKNVVVLLGGVGTAQPTVAVIVGRSAPVAALIVVPLPFRTHVTVVLRVMAGVVVAFATVQASPLALVTLTVVTVQVPAPVFTMFCLSLHSKASKAILLAIY